MLIEKECHVQSQKLTPRVEVGILVKYKGASIYWVYMPSRARDKIVRSSHVRFDKRGLVMKPDFEAIKDEMVCH
jgi:hypothetical protein